MVSCRRNCRAGKAIMWGLLSLLSLSPCPRFGLVYLYIHLSIVVPVRAGELSVFFCSPRTPERGRGGEEGRGGGV